MSAHISVSKSLIRHFRWLVPGLSLIRGHGNRQLFSYPSVVMKMQLCECPRMKTVFKDMRSPASVAVRSYAKGKDKKKESKNKKIVINEHELAQVLDVDNLYSKFRKPVEQLKEEYVNKLTLRTSLGALDTLQISFEGTDYILQDLAQIVRKNPKTLVLNVANFPQVIPEVLKAIEKSSLGLNPQQDGTTLFIPIPKVTKEHRETMSKQAKALFVKCKDSLRDVQNTATKNIKSKEGVAEDLLFSVKEQLVTIADKYIADAEAMMKTKQDELTKTDI